MANPRVLIEQLRLLTADASNYTTDASQRKELKQLTKLASRRLEAPFETLQRLSYCAVPLVVARIGQTHCLFSALANSRRPVWLPDLEVLTGIESAALRPIMDFCCVEDIAVETYPGLYRATPLTTLLLKPVFVDAMTHMHDSILPAFAALNDVLKRPRSPTTSFQVGHRTSEDYYAWLETHPEQKHAFHGFMKAQFSTLRSWLDVVDFPGWFLRDLSSDAVAFVDVGGGAGHQGVALKERFPKLKGRIIIQDKPTVLAAALHDEGIEKWDYDFFTEQPVKDACVYYFRQIMHNYNDGDCVRILQNHIPAMGPSSFIVIDEKVLPDKSSASDRPGAEYTASLSLAMVAMFKAQERRESHWRRLIGRAGLYVIDIRGFTDFDDAAIIVTKA